MSMRKPIVSTAGVALAVSLITSCATSGRHEAGAPEVPAMAGVELIERRALCGNPERAQARLSPDGACAGSSTEVLAGLENAPGVAEALAGSSPH